MTDFYDIEIIVRTCHMRIVGIRNIYDKTSAGVKLTQKTTRLIDLEGVDFPIGIGELVGIVVNNCDSDA
jgi:hypothetical protein